MIHSTGTTPNNYLFAGEQFDPDLNLYFNRARYLNVSTGRFWSMDDYEGVDREPFSLHKYLYVSSNPVGMVDPSGNDGLIDLSAAQGILEELAGTLNTITDTLQTINRVRGTVDLVANIWQVVNTLATGGASSLLVGLPTFDQLAKGIDIEAALSSLAQNGARALGLAALQPIMLEKVVEYFNAKDPAFILYMPLPSPSILIGTPLKVKGIPVKLFFGGGANQGGRLLGIGMLKNQSFRDPNLQIFRMDYHEFHFPPGSLGGPNDLVPQKVTDGPLSLSHSGSEVREESKCRLDSRLTSQDCVRILPNFLGTTAREHRSSGGVDCHSGTESSLAESETITMNHHGYSALVPDRLSPLTCRSSMRISQRRRAKLSPPWRI